MYAYLADFIVRFRVSILALVTLFSLAGLTKVPQLAFDFTPQQLFRSSSDVLEQRERFADTFGREDNLVTILVEAPTVWTPQTLEWMRDTTVRLKDVNGVKNTESLATLEIPRGSDGVMTTTPILPSQGPVTADETASLKALAGEEPLIRGQAVSEDGTVAIIMVWLKDEIQDVTVINQAVKDLQASVDSHRAPPGVDVRLTGIPYLRQEIVENLKRQQLTFIPGTALAYLVILAFMFRRFSGVFLPLAVVGVTCIGAAWMLVSTDSPINIINNVLPSLVFIIGVSDAIHMLVRDAEEIDDGLERLDAIRAMVRHTGAACLLTSLTTAVGFFSLVAADTQILQDFGWQAGLSVVFAYIVTLFCLPAALSFLKPVYRAPRDVSKTPPIDRFLDWLGHWAVRKPWYFILSALIVTCVAGFFAWRVEIDTVLLEVYEHDHPTYQNILLAEQKLGGILPVEISMEHEDLDAFKDPARFAKIAELEQFARKQSIVLSTQSLVDFHQAARAALLDDVKERDNLPDSREQIEQIQLLIAGAPDAQTGPGRFMTTDFRHARLLMRVADKGAKAQLGLGRALKEELARLFPPESGVRFALTGDAYVASLSLDSFIRDLFYSLLLAMVIIFGMMTAVFRSFKLGLVSVLPNVIPLLMTFGYMGMRDIDLNTTTIITFAISLGLAVDDTIHFLARFQEERAHGNSVHDAVIATYQGAGRAIMLTSLMLLVGLVVLMFSDFVPTRLFGTLTSITIAGAIFGRPDPPATAVVPGLSQGRRVEPTTDRRFRRFGEHVIARVFEPAPPPNVPHECASEVLVRNVCPSIDQAAKGRKLLVGIRDRCTCVIPWVDGSSVYGGVADLGEHQTSALLVCKPQKFLALPSPPLRHHKDRFLRMFGDFEVAAHTDEVECVPKLGLGVVVPV
ncbi:MAG: efflux RND transporter permease subunit [bacterium]